MKARETRRSPADRHVWKVRLVKGLYGRGMEPEDVRRLFLFIDWVMELPEPRKHRFEPEIDAFQKEKPMPFVNPFEQVGREKGLLRGIEVALDLKFGAEGLELVPELRRIRDHVSLGKLLSKIKTADSPDDLRRVLTQKRRSREADPMREI